MPLINDLLTDIAAALGAAGAPSVTAASKVADVYEAYVLSVLIQAATNEGASVAFKNLDPGPPTTFVTRTSPGFISQTTPQYGYVEITFPGCPVLEAHVGIYISGKSKNRHEADVVVLRQDEAETCRTNRTLPRSTMVVLAVECKCYQTSPLGVNLGRSFIGLSADLSKSWTTFVANKFASSVDSLLLKHKNERLLNVVPSNTLAVNQLRVRFENLFKDFKTRST